MDHRTETGERTTTAAAPVAGHFRFFEATLWSIPDYVYAFDSRRRFAYVNSAMAALLGLSAEQMQGKTFEDIGYPSDLISLLNGHIDRVFDEGVTIEEEVLVRNPTGHPAWFAYLWGPVRGEDGSVELVVGVSRDTSARRNVEEALRKSELRLKAAAELVGIGIYSWDPVTNELDWDERVRAIWGLPADAHVDMDVYEAGIHSDDRPRVREAIEASIDPSGNGHYSVEYRVLPHDGRALRHIATAGRTTFRQGRPVSFIGAVIDMTAQRRAEEAIRQNEVQFRSFADNSSNLIWIGDPVSGTIDYRSAAFERIWGIPVEEGATNFADWLQDVHPDDRQQVELSLAAVTGGEAAQFEYRILRPRDGTIRWLRDTSFPIMDEDGSVGQIGGITEDLTQEDLRHVYIVSGKETLSRKLALQVRALGYRPRVFESASAFLAVASVLAPGCVVVNLRTMKDDALAILRELKARSICLPTIVLDAADADVTSVVAAMKAGAVDYVVCRDDDSFQEALARAILECRGAARPTARDDNAASRVARLTPREREVLIGLVDGGTNKIIGQKLGISPRTVELHRAQVMNRLNASSLTELLQLALAAGITPPLSDGA